MMAQSLFLVLFFIKFIAEKPRKIQVNDPPLFVEKRILHNGYKKKSSNTDMKYDLHKDLKKNLKKISPYGKI